MEEWALPRIRCSEELRKAVEVAAAKEDRTVSNWILKVVNDKLKEEKKMTDYGTVKFEGKTYTLTSDADLTNRLLETGVNFHEAEDGEEYTFEMKADAVDENGVEVVVYWMFDDIKGREKESLDQYNYDKVDRVEVE